MIVFLQQWGYLAIFGFLFLENVALVGVFVPGITIMITAGFLAGTGVLSPVLAFAAAWLGVVAGDVTCYLIGRYALTKSDRLRRLVERIDIQRLHSWTVLFFQFPVPTRVGVPLLAGSIKFSPARAFVTEVAATTLFVSTVGGVGLIAGMTAGSVADAERWGSWLQFVFLGLFVVWTTWIAVVWWREHRRRRTDGGKP